MSNTIFRMFNPNGPKEDPVEKRRGQLRRAQKNFRDRKDKYTKALEQELAQCRASKASLMHEADSLRATVNLFAQLLSEHGIDAPGNVLATSHQTHSEGGQTYATSESTENYYSAKNGQTPVETPQWSSPESSAGYSAVDSQANHEIQQQYHQQKQYTLKPANSFTDILKPPQPFQNQDGRLCDLDIVNVGMEFVLTLERPCLGHIHGDPNKPAEPNGHALTTSATLLCACPSSPPEDSTPSFQNAPAALLDRLLNLSPNLSTDGEVTPIQAWNFIRTQPRFGGLSTRELGSLAEELREAVKCHGFGAVIQQGTFENLVYKTLLLGRTF